MESPDAESRDVLEIDREKWKAKKIKLNTETPRFNVEKSPMRRKKPRALASHNFYYFHGVFTRT
jgi:hypothetical protein